MPDAEEISTSSIPFPIKSSLAAHDGVTPQLPPQMQSVRSHTADEIVEMMNKTPLFMTSLDNVDDGPSDFTPKILDIYCLRLSCRGKP